MAGVDAWRSQIRELSYAPLGGKATFIIVDECHMLSKSAWNVLLKPTEDTPAHVFWAFCTTEPNKVLQHGFMDIMTIEPLTAKRGDQCRMNVYHAEREVIRQGYLFEKAPHDDQVGSGFPAVVENRLAECVARAELGAFHDDCWNAGLLCVL